jgi:deoxyadenosine/deoxycytidine kinase
MYILEGNIGAGKSTFLTVLSRTLPNIEVIFEPINNWQKNIYGQSLLSNFYQDSQRWAYTFETFAMACRIREHLKDQENSNPFRIIERSIYSGHYCFALNGYANGYMSALEWHVYNQWFSMLIPSCKAPRGFIYVRADPEIAYQRIKKRNRTAEATISFDYVKQIHDYHERFLIHKVDILPSLKNVPVLILDCNEDFEESTQKQGELIDQVQKFLIDSSMNH